MTISDKIKEILKVKKWKQKRLAVELGVSQQCLSNWKNDNNTPNDIWVIDAINTLYNKIFKA